MSIPFFELRTITKVIQLEFELVLPLPRERQIQDRKLDIIYIQ